MTKLIKISSLLFILINSTLFAYQRNDIVINEIMADPTPIVALPAYEYIELYNRTDKPINLNGWSIITGTRSKKISKDIYINPLEYLIITDSSAEKYFRNICLVASISHLSINNEAQIIAIKDNSGKIISSFDFNIEMYNDDKKKNGGWSLEQIDYNNLCGNQDNWIPSISNSGGTPGYINSVANNNTCSKKLKIINVYPTDSMHLELRFNKAFNPSSLNNNLDIFNLNSISTKITSYYLDSILCKKIYITLDNPIIHSVIYNINISNISDCSNQSYSDLNSDFALPEEFSSNDIIINEILTDVSKNTSQFIELYNNSNHPIDLKNLMLATEDPISNIILNPKNIALDGHILMPQEYIAVTEKPSRILNYYPSSNPDNIIPVNTFPQYNQDNGIILLINRDSLTIDRLVYSKNMHNQILSETKDISLERINFNTPSDLKTNWSSASQTCGFATPASANSQQSVLKDNENIFSLNSKYFSPDNDNYLDILLINYQNIQPGSFVTIKVFSDKGRLFCTLINNKTISHSGSFVWDGTNLDYQKAEIGLYIIIIELLNLNGTKKIFKFPVAVSY